MLNTGSGISCFIVFILCNKQCFPLKVYLGIHFFPFFHRLNIERKRFGWETRKSKAFTSETYLLQQDMYHDMSHILLFHFSNPGRTPWSTRCHIDASRYALRCQSREVPAAAPLPAVLWASNPNRTGLVKTIPNLRPLKYPWYCRVDVEWTSLSPKRGVGGGV